MKRSFILASILAIAASHATATKHTVTFSGLTFSPSTLTITEGDTVVFVLSGLHNAQEVSQSTWNANGTTPLGGGFSVPFGGGEAVPAGTGTHYFVCQNHVISGMKGRIIVEAVVVPPSSVTINSIVDRDGSIGTTADRIGKNWSLKLYRDSVGSGIVVDSVSSGKTLLADSLPAGTYVAVEADSAHWTHISQTVDGSPLGLTSLNFLQIAIGTGEDHTVDFLNYAKNVIIHEGFTFIPETLVVDSSDTVRFVLEPTHNAREVDSLTWAGDDTVSNGGFEIPYGGGEAVLSQVGTVRYVCVPHAVAGMKGVIVVKPAGTLSLTVTDGWNLLSMPFLPVDGSVAVLYPTATSPAYSYEGGYQTETVVGPGSGYWLKFGSAQSLDLDGGLLAVDSVEVSQGWNIIGTISAPVAVASIVSEPGGLVTSSFFGYDLGYITADTLHPGYGYWVKVGAPGVLILQDSPSMAPESGRIRIVPAVEVPAAAAPPEVAPPGEAPRR